MTREALRTVSIPNKTEIDLRLRLRKVAAVTPGRDQFLHRENVANYQRLLSQGPDEATRRLILTLLGEESARAAAAGWTRDLRTGCQNDTSEESSAT